MPYYLFNRFTKGKLGDLGDLCKTLGLKESKCRDGMKEWDMRSPSDPVYLINYDPHRKMPIVLQTKPTVSHKDPRVKELMRQIMSISGSTEVYHGWLDGKKLNILGRYP